MQRLSHEKQVTFIDLLVPFSKKSWGCAYTACLQISRRIDGPPTSLVVFPCSISSLEPIFVHAAYFKCSAPLLG